MATTSSLSSAASSWLRRRRFSIIDAIQATEISVFVTHTFWRDAANFLHRHASVSLVKILEGRYYTAITYAFYQKDLVQLLVSAASLQVSGRQILEHVGSRLFAVTYAAGALGGAALSVTAARLSEFHYVTSTTGNGASLAAVLALHSMLDPVASMTVPILNLRYPTRYYVAGMMVFHSAALFIPRICEWADHYATLGGYLTGLLIGLVVRRYRGTRRRNA